MLMIIVGKKVSYPKPYYIIESQFT